MRDIISWLFSVENMAGAFYRDAAELFKEDRELSAFLSNLSSDEEWHASLMTAATRHMDELSDKFIPAITLDSEIKGRIEDMLIDKSKALAAGELTKERLFGAMLDIEFCELNDIFLYVINTLNDFEEEFGQITPKILQHTEQVRNFVKSQPDGDKLLAGTRGVLHVWKKKILIVDDSEATREFLKAVLGKHCLIETAENGEDALKKVEAEYFDAIISDVEMPVMNGIEFFEQARRQYPGIGNRFIFFTGALEKYLPFFEKFNLWYLTKPVPISSVRKMITDVMDKAVGFIHNDSPDS